VAGVALIAFDKSDNLYVTNSAVNAIRKFSPTGEDLGDFATAGLDVPVGLAFDTSGNLYVANRVDNTSCRDHWLWCRNAPELHGQ
jgi:DNA-binding beta-propeller fold protein YncE